MDVSLAGQLHLASGGRGRRAIWIPPMNKRPRIGLGPRLPPGAPRINQSITPAPQVRSPARACDVPWAAPASGIAATCGDPIGCGGGCGRSAHLVSRCTRRPSWPRSSRCPCPRLCCRRQRVRPRPRPSALRAPAAPQRHLLPGKGARADLRPDSREQAHMHAKHDAHADTTDTADTTLHPHTPHPHTPNPPTHSCTHWRRQATPGNETRARRHARARAHARPPKKQPTPRDKGADTKATRAGDLATT